MSLMTHRLHRFYDAGELHFITCSCYRKLPLFRFARGRDRFLSILEQMHHNPVKRGMVSQAEEWRWSSYRFYFLDEVGLVEVNQGWGKISFRDGAA
jgi:REP element-mobilizing transposase RayT